MYADGERVGDDTGVDRVSKPTELVENHVELYQSRIAKSGRVENVMTWRTTLDSQQVADMHTKGTGTPSFRIAHFRAATGA